MDFSELIRENWHSLKINDKNYLFKCLFSENDYQLLLFNLRQCNLFVEKKSKTDIEKDLRKYNESIEAPISKINLHLKNCLLSDIDSCEFNEKKSGSNLVIKMVSQLAGVKFDWIFDLEMLDYDSIKEHLVLPLLYNCIEYQSREQELIKIIQLKDKEIEDYKSQGIKLNRKYLETEMFNKDNFNAIIKKKKTDNLDNPEEVLCNKLTHIVHTGCALRYYPVVTQSSEAKASSEKTPMKIQKATETQKVEEKEVSRLEALKQKLKEDEKKPSPQKKKKLFK